MGKKLHRVQRGLGKARRHIGRVAKHAGRIADKATGGSRMLRGTGSAVLGNFRVIPHYLSFLRVLLDPDMLAEVWLGITQHYHRRAVPRPGRAGGGGGGMGGADRGGGGGGGGGAEAAAAVGAPHTLGGRTTRIVLHRVPLSCAAAMPATLLYKLASSPQVRQCTHTHTQTHTYTHGAVWAGCVFQPALHRFKPSFACRWSIHTHASKTPVSITGERRVIRQPHHARRHHVALAGVHALLPAAAVPGAPGVHVSGAAARPGGSDGRVGAHGVVAVTGGDSRWQGRRDATSGVPVA
mgnify:CR=1 FL=1